MKVLKINYAFTPQNRARRIIAFIKKILEKNNLVLKELDEDSMLDYIEKQIYFDRGRGMSLTFLSEEQERALKTWDIIVAKHTRDIMNYKSFSCILCGQKIREGGKIHSHLESCPLYGYRLDFIKDIDNID